MNPTGKDMEIAKPAARAAEARPEFPRARDLAACRFKWDLHSHTSFVHGQNTVREMLDRAEEMGFSVFAITEHVRASAMGWWKRYVDEIRRERVNRGMKVLIGMEANAFGPAGSVDVTSEMWDDAEFVLGAVHGYYRDDGIKIPDGSLPAKVALAYETEKALGLCGNPKIHVLAHPGWLYEKNYGCFPLENLREVFERAKDTGTAVEICGTGPKSPTGFCSVLRDVDPTVSFGSNAHSTQEIRDMLQHAKELHK